MDVKRMVEATDTRAGQAFDLAIQGLVVVSLVSFALETNPRLPPVYREALRWSEFFIVAVFTVEYALRIVVADRKLSFVFSFFGLVDLLAIAPFYLAQGIDLRSLRVVRLLRVFRVLKLARYDAAIQRLRRAARIAREELIVFGCAALALLYVSAVGIYYFEREAQPEQFASILHSLWWAVVTLTTVGYGDVYPVTAGGRLFTSVVLLVGLGVVAVPTGLIASALSVAREGEARRDGRDAPR